MLTRQAKRLLQAGAILASLLTLMYITDFSLPSPKGRAEGDFSSTATRRPGHGCCFAPILSDESAAAGLGGVDSQEATLCVQDCLVGGDLEFGSLGFSNGGLGGHGYGFPLGDLVPYLEGEFIRTPHNEFFYALGYTGWIGVLLFAPFSDRDFSIALGTRTASMADHWGIIFGPP